MPTISVIIPFFNRVEWLTQAIESILRQSYQDYEIILVDDGSSEDLSTISKYLELLNVFIYRQNNKGPAAARNYGIKMAAGKYLAFLDSDDMFAPEKLEVQIKVMEENPEAVLSHTSYQRIEASGDPLDIVHSGTFCGFVFPQIYDGCPIATPTVMVKKKVFESVLGFNEKLRIAEDVLLWAEISRLGPILGVDQPFSLVRMHGQNSATDYKAQITGEANIIQYGLLHNSSINWYQRRRILSAKYLNLSGYFFYYRDYKNVLKNLILSLYYYPRRGLGFIYHQITPITKKFLRKLFRKTPGPSMGRNSLVK